MRKSQPRNQNQAVLHPMLLMERLSLGAQVDGAARSFDRGD